MSIQIEEGKFYKRADGSVHGPAKWNDFSEEGQTDAYPWRIGNGDYTPSGRYHEDQEMSSLDLVAEAPNPAIEDDGFITRDTPDWAAQVEAEAATERDESVVGKIDGRPVYDIKTQIADEAKNIVNGARRSAYGRPESNFERIARYWDAYFKNTGRNITITAADVSPLMRLMKEARLNETPDHRDSHVDLVGYALTGAEVAGVKAT